MSWQQAPGNWAQSAGPAQEALVFDETSGQFIEVENDNPENTTTSISASTDQTTSNGKDDWVAYSNPPDDGTANSNDTGGLDESAAAIDWDAGGEDVNDLIPPPPPGRSGMKHARGKGAG